MRHLYLSSEPKPAQIERDRRLIYYQSVLDHSGAIVGNKMEWLLVSAVALVFSCFFEVSFGEETTKGLSECLLFTNVLQLFLKFLQVSSF